MDSDNVSEGDSREHSAVWLRTHRMEPYHGCEIFPCKHMEAGRVEKPIHVQVAEVLNTYHTEHLWEERDWVNQGCAYCDNSRDEPCAPRYDLDWSATGPLVEKYGINLHFNGEHWFADAEESDGVETCMHLGPRSGFAPCRDRADKPLLSVCQCILALKEAGKL